MSCPYPTPESAARHLHCGYDPSTCNGPIAKLFIVSFSIPATVTRERLAAVAAAGGGRVFFADTELELVEAAHAALEAVLADANE